MLLLGIQATADALSRKLDSEFQKAIASAMLSSTQTVAALVGIPTFKKTARRDLYRLGLSRPRPDGSHYQLFYLTCPLLTADPVTFSWGDTYNGAGDTVVTDFFVDRDGGIVETTDGGKLENAWAQISYTAGFTELADSLISSYTVFQGVPDYLTSAALLGARLLLADNPRYVGDGRQTSGAVLRELAGTLRAVLDTHARVSSSRYNFPEYSIVTG